LQPPAKVALDYNGGFTGLMAGLTTLDKSRKLSKCDGAGRVKARRLRSLLEAGWI